MGESHTVCVFAGARGGSNVTYVEAARGLGARLAEAGLRLVYGGGGTGLMGTLARSALEHGGEVVGVIPKALRHKSLEPSDGHVLRVVDTMHQRKALMADLSDAFVALPGGLGTLEELIECLTWKDLRLHSKPVIVLNVDGYYLRLEALLEVARTEGFLATDLGVPEFLGSTKEAVDRLSSLLIGRSHAREER